MVMGLVDSADLIDSKEVAATLGLSRHNAVSLYRSRYDDLPTPVGKRGNSLLWRRADIKAWAERRPRRRTGRAGFVGGDPERAE